MICFDSMYERYVYKKSLSLRAYVFCFKIQWRVIVVYIYCQAHKSPNKLFQSENTHAVLKFLVSHCLAMAQFISPFLVLPDLLLIS